jgi:RimJ/RimL family protein N-acetyltransferase
MLGLSQSVVTTVPGRLETDRLCLRRWRDGDRLPFAAMNADRRVMKYFPATLTSEESDAAVAKMEAHFEKHSFGLWAVEILETSQFAGFIGLSVPEFNAPFMPCVEIGWRLVVEHWGRGYATEGARAVLAFGFRSLELNEIVSFTSAANVRSRRVMERLGMVRNPADDFDHPAIEAEHPLRRHVLYRVTPQTLPKTSQPGDVL